MAELQKLLLASGNGNDKSQLMQAFLSESQISLRGQSSTSSSITTSPSSASVNASLSPFSTTTGATNQSILQDDINGNMNINSNMNANINNSNNSNITSTTTNLNLNANANLTSTSKSTKSNETESIQVEAYANLADCDRILSEVKNVPVEDRLSLLNLTTNVIMDAHVGTTLNTHENVANARKRITANSPKTDQMPDMSKLSINPSDIMQQFMKSMMPEMTKVIRFVKKLPGFAEISQMDQMRLIKQGSFEVMLTRFSMLIDEDKELMLDPALEKMCPRKIVSMMPMGQFLDEFFTIAQEFNPLRLTDGEIGLFSGVLMMNSDREGLEDKIAVKLIQDLYLQALYHQLKVNHEDCDQTFTSLLQTVPSFRRVNILHDKVMSQMRMKSPGELDNQFPPLHKEMYPTRPS